MKKVLCFLFSVPCLLTFGQFTNIQIDPSNTYGETSILVNPKNTNQLVAGCNISNVYYSSNGGLNWTTVNLTSTWGNQGDPCAAVDTNGNWYFSHLNPSQDRIVVAKSTNGGATWPTESFTGLTTKDTDKEWILVDWSPNSPYKNDLYCTWAEMDAYSSNSPLDSSRIFLSKSMDDGATWTSPSIVSVTQANCGTNAIKGSVPAIGPNGEVYVTWCGLGVSFQKSVDGGQTWMMSDLIVDSQVPFWYFTVPGFTYGTGFPGIACDVSGGPNNGNIYITWCDQRNGVNNTDIFLARSTNGGNSWSTIRVNNDVTVTHQSHPWVTVDQTNGNVYLSFYDRRDFPSGNNTHVYLAYSTDGGQSFYNQRVTQNFFTPNSVWCDYNNITAHADKIWPIWTGASASVWTSIITFSLLGENEIIQETPKLFQNYPNPFNSYTFFDFSLPAPGKASMIISDVLGREIAVIFKDEEFDTGVQHAEIQSDKLGLKPGIYFCELSTPYGSDTRKIQVIE